MKTLSTLTSQKVVTFFILCLSIFTGSCSDDEKKAEPSLFDIQLKKLAHTWSATNVTLNGDDKTAEYNSFTLVLTGEEGELAYQYVASGRPDLSPWKSSGEWAFDFNGDVETKLQRDAGADAINVLYVVTETTLELTFGFVGEGYGAKTQDATGTWVFRFVKE